MADSKHVNIKDLTQCGICLSTQEEPKALPCLHSYCLKCLTEWAKGKKDKVRCPLCVQDFSIPKDGVKGFRTNFFINTLKERRATAEKLQAKDSVIPCNCCGAVDHKAEAYCTSCGGFVCGDCVGIHRKVKHMSSHKLIPFEDLRSGKVDVRSLSQQKFCKIHEGQVLWFYCETCGVLICRDCTVLDHPPSSHTLVNLESATKGQKKEIEQLIRDCGKGKKAVADALEEVESVLVNLSKNAAKTNAKIDDSFDEYKKTFLRLLEEKRSAVKSEVQQTMSQRKKQLDAQKDEIQLQQTRLHTALQMASEVTNTGSDYDLAVAYTSLKSNLTQLQDMKPAPVQRHLGVMSFKPEQVSQPVLPSLGSLSFGCKKEGVGVWKLEGEFGMAGEGKLSAGRGIAIAPNGDIIVANYSGGGVMVYAETGKFKCRLETNQGLKEGKTTNPWDVAVSSDGRIFITHRTSHVNVHDDKGYYLHQFPTKSPSNLSSASQNTSHYGLAIDNQGHLLVSETNQKYISRHQLDGTHITSFKVNMAVVFIAVNRHNKIIISGSDNSLTNDAQILDHTGQLLYNLKRPQGSNWNPQGLCCTTSNEVYIASYMYNSSVSIVCYSSESGDYIGCVTKEVNKPVGLALTDDGEKLLLAQNTSVKVFRLQWKD